jgi:protein-L-isoaspartate(D-aspartate) O-methyltransferase
MTNVAETAWFDSQRRRMVEFQLCDRGIRDQRVLDAMGRVPRHEFAPREYWDQAYEDHPLPIAEGQTISQPFIVALMLEAVELQPADKVLEVGTGSGYVTALLAEMVREVVSIERHASLSERAGQLVRSMGYSNVQFIVGDGSRGFAANAPYDAILVSAAAHEMPHALVDQLAEGGRMIIPVGREESQQLQLIRRTSDGIETTLREYCRFVPLISDAESATRPGER